MTADLVHRVVKHGASGMSIYQIAAALGLSKAAVTKIIAALKVVGKGDKPRNS